MKQQNYEKNNNMEISYEYWMRERCFILNNSLEIVTDSSHSRFSNGWFLLLNKLKKWKKERKHTNNLCRIEIVDIHCKLGGNKLVKTTRANVFRWINWRKNKRYLIRFFFGCSLASCLWHLRRSFTVHLLTFKKNTFSTHPFESIRTTFFCTNKQHLLWFDCFPIMYQNDGGRERKIQTHPKLKMNIGQATYFFVVCLFVCFKLESNSNKTTEDGWSRERKKAAAYYLNLAS